MKNLFILASHGNLAEGLKNTIGMLYGNQENILAYGLHDGENVEDICKSIKEEILESDAEKIVAITDLPGGSVNNNLMELIGLRGNFYLVSGMNVGLVLELVLNENITEESISECIERGRDTLQLFTAKNITDNVDEGGDFFD